MARVALVCADLLFGSKLDGMLRAAGHEVAWNSGAEGADAAVIDLAEHPEPLPVPSLGFYSHVDVETRRSAEAAGFDLVVPRSRMAREGAALVDRLLA
ncbi:MAG TPA: hypothetical protein VNT32_11795 [Thermoleophilaceae bacterium]|nr:hypothetical protein [Thermoleophilaceae bacterium]